MLHKTCNDSQKLCESRITVKYIFCIVKLERNICLLQLHYAVAMGRGVLCPAPYPPGGLSLAALAALHQDRLLTKNSSIADLRLKAKKHAEAISRDQEIV